jgi:hypothetical protein
VTLPILIDCDGVLANFADSCLRLAREKGGVYALESDLTSWDMAKSIGWPRLDVAIEDAVAQADLCYRIAEYPDAIAWLRDLENTFGSENVLICTSPLNGEWAAQRISWLERRGVPLRRQIHCHQKWRIRGYLIDDAAHAMDREHGFLLARPWNKSYKSGAPRGDYAAAKAWLKEKSVYAPSF